MGDTSDSNAIGFLGFPTCNQDENHFNWILSYLLNTHEAFRHGFLERTVGLDPQDRVQDFVATYQQSSVSSRPDLKVRFASETKSFLVFVETKVESPVDSEQLSRHQEGLEREKWLVEISEKQVLTALVLLAPRAAIPDGISPVVRKLAWEEIHDMLLLSESRGPGVSISVELARILEARGLADFAGFDVEAWKKYLDMRVEHARLIKQIEDQAGNFVSSVRTAVNKAVLEGKAPFNSFEPAAAARGTALEFLIYPKAVAREQTHWGHVLVLLDEGQIEASCGTSTTRNCPPFLKAIERHATEWSKTGWQLWYAGGGVETYTELSSWKPLLDAKVTEISLLRMRGLASDKDVLASSQVVKQTFEDLAEACRFLVELTG